MKRFAWLLACMTLLLAGCGPKFLPVHAGFESGVARAGERSANGPVVTVLAGQSVLAYADSFRQPAFVPRTNLTPAPVRGRTFGPMDSSRPWANWWRLDDGTLVVQPPPGYADGYGLRVDGTGQVVGRRPWLDVRKRVRPSQEPWDGRMRQVFSPAGAIPVDIFEHDLVYRGVAGKIVLFGHRMRKAGGDWAEESLVAGDVLHFEGLTVEILDATPESLKCRVNRMREDAQGS